MSGQRRMFIKVARATAEESMVSGQYAMSLFVASLVTSLFIMFTSYFPESGVKGNLAMAVYVAMMVVMVVAAVLATASFSGEIDGRTMALLFSLPIGRSTLYLGKLAGIMVAMVPVVAMPFITYLLLLSTVTGAVSHILLSMAAGLFVLSVLMIAAIVAAVAFLSLLLRRTLYTLGAAGAYLMTMIFLAPTLNDFSGQRIVYAPDYALLFPFPYAVIAAATKSVRVLNEVDPLLYVTLLLFILIATVLGLAVIRRMEL